MLYLFYKIILFTFFVYAIEYEAFFIGLAVISMFYGTVMALYQTKLIRVMAYSSVSHMSHLLLALCIGTEEAVFSFLVYLIIYILLSLGVFSMLILFRNKDLTNLSIINIVDLSYLSNAAR
jgi:NADH-quinone oxidoreductase subunit N